MFTEASTCIYSIPYILEEFFLTSETHMHENTKTISKNEFNKVHHLSIDPCRIEDDCEYYFPNVTALQIGDLSSLHRKTVLTELHVKYLPKIVNLMNIKSLRFTFNESRLKDELVFFNWIIRNKKSNLRDYIACSSLFVFVRW